jgi:hypothetical protein
LRDGSGGLIVRCWAGCNPRDVTAALRARRLIGFSGREIRPAPARAGSADSAWRMALARRIWTVAGDAAGSPVADYLAARDITVPPPPALRYAPSLRRPDRTHGPAMVARVDDIDGELIGVHRTWLDRRPDGRWQRRDRAMLGRAAGGAVRLAPAAESLMIAEGIETAMAAMTRPAWAALSTSGMIALVLPPIVRGIVILADHDVSGAGERAARAAAARWLAEGRRVRIATPPAPGTDFADVLFGGSYARITEAADAAA